MRVLAPAWLLVCGACSSADYAVTIRLPTNDVLAQTRSVDVFVLATCGEVGAPGATPAHSLSAQTVYGTTGSAPLGNVSPGSIAVYARARGADCTVLAAACQMFAVQADGRGVLTLPLTALTTPGPACDPPATCTNGGCPLPVANSDANPD
jgi:hypothetical protein